MKTFTRDTTLLMALVVLLFVAASCGKRSASGKPSGVDYYTCAMHPSVKSQDPKGKCPICGMELVPVMKQSGGEGPTEASPPKKHNEGTEAKASRPQQGQRKVKYYKSTMMPGETSAKPAKDSMGMDMVPVFEDEKSTAGNQPSEFVVPVERQQQIGVRYAKVERKPLGHTIRAVGLIVPDKTRNWQFVSRVDGYVQKLDVTAPGELVEKDTPLLSIYSPDLFSSEREFVELLRMRDQAKSKDARETPQRLIESAKRRLQLWNVTDQQIADLERTRKASDTLTLLSPFRGVVQSVPVEQGKNVKVGDMLVEVADLSVVWVWAEFYETELSMLQVGQKISITTKSYPGEKFQGTIGVINPFLDETKRTAKVRIDIPNPDFKLRPGMYVNAELEMDMGQALTIPVSAVMPTGSRNIVFVDKGQGKLEPRIVQLGTKYGDIYEVKSGLQGNEQVVASANFLIDAESKVQGALRQFEESQTPQETPTPGTTP
ncbi:MAG TPA: efflux RND transporter periplasmic adaptor subunit [Candidatus Udaeobacter sp.]|nr:efflux RND transporter periplasmic adaptor subunit [Candidatus Udaeobacter sp.]